MKAFTKLLVMGLTAAALAFTTNSALAENTNRTSKAGAEAKEAGSRKLVAHPFHGKLAAMDKTMKTITVGKGTFQITSETQIKKAGKPATLDEAVVGEEVSGYVKPDETGKMIATKLNIGPKAAPVSEKKAESAGKAQRQ